MQSSREIYLVGRDKNIRADVFPNYHNILIELRLLFVL